jgi:hypothetical protein
MSSGTHVGLDTKCIEACTVNIEREAASGPSGALEDTRIVRAPRSCAHLELHAAELLLWYASYLPLAPNYKSSTPISLKVHFRAYSIAQSSRSTALGISSVTAMSPILLSARKSPTSSARLCGPQLGQRRILSASRFIRRPVVPALQHPSPEHLPYNAIINASGCGALEHVWGPNSRLNYGQQSFDIFQIERRSKQPRVTTTIVVAAASGTRRAVRKDVKRRCEAQAHAQWGRRLAFPADEEVCKQDVPHLHEHHLVSTPWKQNLARDPTHYVYAPPPTLPPKSA